MKKSMYLFISTFFLFSFQSYSAKIILDEAEEIYDQSRQDYDEAYALMINESDISSRRALVDSFTVDNSFGGEEDTLTQNKTYLREEYSEYREALENTYETCAGEAGKLQALIPKQEESDVIDLLARAEGNYRLCARQASGELNHFF